MSKIRIHELAKELNTSSKELVDVASKLGIEAKSHMSTLEDAEVSKIRSRFNPKPSSRPNNSNNTNNNRNTGSNNTNRTSNSNNSNYQNRSNDSRSNDNRRSNSNYQSNNRNNTGSNNSGSYNKERSTTSSNSNYNKDRSSSNYNKDRSNNSNGTNSNYRNNTSSNTNSSNSNYKKNYNNRDNSQNSNRSSASGDSNSRSYNNNRTSNYNNRNNSTGSSSTNTRSSNTSTGNRSEGRPSNPNYKGRSNNTSGGYNRSNSSYNKDKEGGNSNYQNRGKKPAPKKKIDSTISDIIGSDIQEKTPKRKKGKKDKIVMTFDTDKLATKAKKNIKLKKEELAAPSQGRREFDFGKKTKQKRNKYQKQQEREKLEKLEEKLQKEVIFVPEEMTVGDLADLINKPSTEVIMKLMSLGVMATINQDIDYDSAALVAAEYNITLEQEEPEEKLEETYELDFEDDPKSLLKRAPVVTVMGHVDHGKTSLLDAIRNTGIADGEAGGITQHIGASEINYNGEKLVFLDTPGHEAFTSLRARGAQITDIAILVVAADDGVMPQTIEAINHSKAAGVPIIVAINKIDKPNANPERVKQELTEYGIVIEEWGGDVIAVPVSAKKGEGLETLLEMVLLQAEVLELKANPNRLGIGTVIEAKVVKGRGSVATIILEKGQMSIGDPVVAGTAFGKVKALYNHKNKKVKKIGPSTSVEIDGLSEIPQAGEKIYVTPDEKMAREIAEQNAMHLREKSLNKNSGVTLEDLFNRIQEGEIKDLNIIIKADVHGSIEAIKQSLLKLSNDEVRVNIIHSNVGAISETDVTLASASKAIIIGFNVRPSNNVQSLAEEESVDIRTYRIIYDAINDVEAAMTGMLDPTFKEVVLGKIQVRETFKVPGAGMIAGGYVLNGKVVRNAQVRLIRDGIVIYEGKIASLRRFKDDVKEVATGYECGIGLENYNDLQENDEIEAFEMVEVARTKK